MSDIALNSTEIITGVAQVIPQPLIDSIGLFVNIAKVAGILVIIYLVFLIVRSFMRAKTMSDVKKGFKTVKEINDKLDKIIELLEHKKKRKRKS